MRVADTLLETFRQLCSEQTSGRKEHQYALYHFLSKTIGGPNLPVFLHQAELLWSPRTFEEQVPKWLPALANLILREPHKSTTELLDGISEHEAFREEFGKFWMFLVGLDKKNKDKKKSRPGDKTEKEDTKSLSSHFCAWQHLSIHSTRIVVSNKSVYSNLYGDLKKFAESYRSSSLEFCAPAAELLELDFNNTNTNITHVTTLQEAAALAGGIYQKLVEHGRSAINALRATLQLRILADFIQRKDEEEILENLIYDEERKSPRLVLDSLLQTCNFPEFLRHATRAKGADRVCRFAFSRNGELFNVFAQDGIFQTTDEDYAAFIAKQMSKCCWGELEIQSAETLETAVDEICSEGPATSHSWLNKNKCSSLSTAQRNFLFFYPYQDLRVQKIEGHATTFSALHGTELNAWQREMPNVCLMRLRAYEIESRLCKLNN